MNLATQIKVVVFDLGGVLVRICFTWPEAAGNAGLSIQTPDRISDNILEHPLFERYQAGELTDVEFSEALASGFGLASILEGKRLFEGMLMGAYANVAGIIQELHENKVSTGILSNTNNLHWEQMSKPELFPANAIIQRPMASHLVGVNKPEEGIYRAFETQNGFQPEEILFFDDALKNVMAARQFGWHAEHIQAEPETEAQIRQYLEKFGLLIA